MTLKSFLKGFSGELQSTLAKKVFLDSNVYEDINNVTLPTSNGTTQIDHIIVSRFGIFVVETKNMSGWISAMRRVRSGRSPCRAVRSFSSRIRCTRTTGM